MSSSLAKRAGVAIVQRSAGREPGRRQGARGESARVRMRDREGTRKARARDSLLPGPSRRKYGEKSARECVRFSECVSSDSERERAEPECSCRVTARATKESRAAVKQQSSPVGSSLAVHEGRERERATGERGKRCGMRE